MHFGVNLVSVRVLQMDITLIATRNYSLIIVYRLHWLLIHIDIM